MGSSTPKPSADQYKSRGPIAPTMNPYERPALVHSSSYNKNTIDQVAYKPQKFSSFWRLKV